MAKVQAMRTTLSAALTRAMREELVFRNVARLATLPLSGPRRLRPWSPAEARQFLPAARSDPLHPAFVLLLVYGMRRGEVCGLSWDDVDFDARHLRVQWQHYRVGGQLVRGAVKTRAGRRTLPLLPIVAKVLEAHRDQILGHSRISVTMEIYTHADGEAHRDALAKIGNLLDEQEEE